jgi:multicomponent Na+:H+ antiporter subunit G
VTDILVDILMLGGATFVLIASIGILRMPDLYMRMSATTKAGTMGTGLIIAAMIVAFGDFSVLIKGGVLVVFGLLTAPVAAHMISRAAYFQRVPLWEGTVRDDLAGRYEPASHDLRQPIDPGQF